jgi:CDGSH-type Zn-finger protein
MTQVRITVNRTGSLRVEGPIELVDHEGNPFPLREGKPVSLCRCGASQNKPFCDGTHSKIGFLGAEAAVRAADAAASAAPGASPSDDEPE